VNNNQETDRGSVDEVVDEKTQFQMYYPPFEGAIEAGVGSVMCSYNKIRGVWSCENADTLQRDLKERLGFNGWVMSDWGATHSNSSVMAGLDQEMPGSDYLSSDALLSAVKTGALPASRIDDAAMRILTPFFTVGAFDRPNLNTQDSNVSSPEHSALARSLAASSIVLLKNSVRNGLELNNASENSVYRNPKYMTWATVVYRTIGAVYQDAIFSIKAELPFYNEPSVTASPMRLTLNSVTLARTATSTATDYLSTTRPTSVVVDFDYISTNPAGTVPDAMWVYMIRNDAQNNQLDYYENYEYEQADPP